MSPERWPQTLILALILFSAAPPAGGEEPATGPASSPSPRATNGPSSKPHVPRYNLRQLVEMARSTYPGVGAARAAVRAMERDVYRAKWAWIPQGNVRGIVAPAPSVRCVRGPNDTDPNSDPTKRCVETTALNINSFDVAGVLTRIEGEFAMPVYTFGKITSAKRAAEAGVEIRQAQVQSAEDRLELDVTRAYWGLKLAREILDTVRDGRGYLVDAEQDIQKDLDSGEGEYTITDLLRLQTARAEVDVRVPEAEKLERLTIAALATLTGQRGKPFDVDTTVLEVVPGTPLPLRAYLDAARQHRPELRLLDAGVRARIAAAGLEKARFFPDFLLVGMFGAAYTSSTDDPKNAFYSDPFNFLSAGFGLAMSWKWDQVQQYAAYRKAKEELRETELRRDEATRGIELEIEKALADLNEARARLDASTKGEKAARRWLVATSQNLAAGLAETRDLTDALVGFFQLRLRNLQAMYDVNVGWSELGRTIGRAAAKR